MTEPARSPDPAPAPWSAPGGAPPEPVTASASAPFAARAGGDADPMALPAGGRARRAPGHGGVGGQMPLIILILAALSVAVAAVELLLQLTGLLPDAETWFTLYGAFWPQLFHGARPVYPGQVAAMFVSYGFVHAGLLHLGMNMLALVAVGRQIGSIMPAGRIALIYALSQIGGGLGQLWLGDGTTPMVGASGAIFGLVAAEFAVVLVVLRRRGLPVSRLASPLAQFVGLNLLLTLAVPAIAWQAHLGGAVVGFLSALILTRWR